MKKFDYYDVAVGDLMWNIKSKLIPDCCLEQFLVNTNNKHFYCVFLTNVLPYNLGTNASICKSKVQIYLSLNKPYDLSDNNF